MIVYYFLSNLDKSEYDYFMKRVKEVKTIQDTDDMIEKYYKRYWVPLPKDWVINNAFIELMMFLKYMMVNDICSLDDIVYIYYKNFILYNDDLYVEFEWSYVKVVQDKIWLVTSRDSFRHPLFIALINQQKKLKNPKIKVFMPNFFWNRSFYDKLYFIWKLYPKRKDTIWDICIPFLMKNDVWSVQRVLSFAKEKLWEKLILKKNFWQAWVSVKLFDASNIDEDRVDYIKIKFFQYSWYSTESTYIMPYYKIIKEYRLYFVYKKWEIKIYSWKNKKNLSNEKELATYKDFGILNSIKADRQYMDPDEFIKQNKLMKYATWIIKNAWLQTWVLEFCEVEWWKLIFLEINNLWWALMMPWKDVEMQCKFNYDIRDCVL